MNKLLASSVMILTSLVVGVGTAYAAHYYGGYSLHEASSASDHCLYHRPSMRVPSNAAGWQMDYNAWTYRKNYRSDIGCTVNNAGKSFPSNTYGIASHLARTDNLNAMCDFVSIGVPAGYSNGFGVGRAYNKQGVCNGTNNFTVWSKSTNFWTGTTSTSFMTGSF